MNNNYTLSIKIPKVVKILNDRLKKISEERYLEEENDNEMLE